MYVCHRYLITPVILFIGSNILMQKGETCNCECEHPILCTCKEDDTIICKISDFDLVNKASKITDRKWIKRLNPNPAGSRGMIAPEVIL